ncbi:helix-turn-helix domain-containing protein [Paenibacillus cisolokensis]|uniref:helix-turn-helix domain-containing protein n=2 Tax=Paenibacillus TaxID=44249 RepID=UPI00071EBA7F|nr:helix-turn-helix domain-containing protein [Paenibacillus sp. 32O-W]ALS26216.1 transposase [Paenibacillus sp. 32O-W]ALS30164.1 transposase [Paenibacillus sp. 32O-W]
MRRSNKLYEEVRLDVVREALSGIKVGVLARKYNLHPETVRTWIRTYRDQVDIHKLPPADHQLQELKRLQEVEEKYEKAMKVLGEKELEIEILRELLKKQNPAYPKNLN